MFLNLHAPTVDDAQRSNKEGGIGAFFIRLEVAGNDIRGSVVGEKQRNDLDGLLDKRGRIDRWKRIRLMQITLPRPMSSARTPPRMKRGLSRVPKPVATLL